MTTRPTIKITIDIDEVVKEALRIAMEADRARLIRAQLVAGNSTETARCIARVLVLFLTGTAPYRASMNVYIPQQNARVSEGRKEFILEGCKALVALPADFSARVNLLNEVVKMVDGLAYRWYTSKSADATKRNDPIYNILCLNPENFADWLCQEAGRLVYERDKVMAWALADIKEQELEETAVRPTNEADSIVEANA